MELITSVVKCFSKDFPRATLKSTTVHRWKIKYLSEMGKRKHDGGKFVVKTLVVAKMGQPLLLGEDLGKKVQNYFFSLREVGYQYSNHWSCSNRHGEEVGSQIIESQWRLHTQAFQKIGHDTCCKVLVL